MIQVLKYNKTVSKDLKRKCFQYLGKLFPEDRPMIDFWYFNDK